VLKPGRVLAVALMIALAIVLMPHRIREMLPFGDKRPASAPEEAAGGYGTNPHVLFVPESAIDSQELPNMVFRASDDADAPLPYFEVGPQTYMLFGNVAGADTNNRGWTANAGFVVTDDGVVVVDALGTPQLGRRMFATIRSVTDKPVSHLILTNTRPDHLFGTPAFRQVSGVRIIAHPGAIAYLRSAEMARAIERRRSLLPGDMEGFEVVRPDMLAGGELFEELILRVGGKTFDIYNTGNHSSSGDLIVEQVEDGIVWISDLAVNQRIPFMGDGDSRVALEALEWLKEGFADARLMIPGHGSAQKPPFPMIERTRGYVQRLRDALEQAIREGKGEQEAVEKGDFAEWENTPLYGLYHPENTRRVYQELIRTTPERTRDVVTAGP
jgi:glyoxylase-like metal-dependent hydrolase (beta-lactamase superfamily II)